MAGSVNKVILIGSLGADPEVRKTQDGRSIVNIRLATNDSWTDKQTKERREKVEWHTVVIFNEQIGKIAQQYLKKGSKVYFEGQLQTRKWQDNAGVDRYTTEVVLQNYNGQLTLLDGRSSQDDGSSREAHNKAKASGYQPEGRQIKQFEKDLDDEIPFIYEWRG